MPYFYSFNKSLDIMPFSDSIKFSSVVKNLCPKEEP